MIRIRQIKMAQVQIQIRIVQARPQIKMARAQMGKQLTILSPSLLVPQNSRLMSGITVMRTKLKTSMIQRSELSIEQPSQSGSIIKLSMISGLRLLKLTLVKWWIILFHNQSQQHGSGPSISVTVMVKIVLLVKVEVLICHAQHLAAHHQLTQSLRQLLAPQMV